MFSVPKEMIKNKLMTVADSLSGSPFLQKSDLKANLESSKLMLKRAAIRSVINFMSSGTDMSHLFISVIKNISHDDPHIRKLVLIYLMHYGSAHEEETLLVVSSLQRFLKNPDALLRGDALKALTSLPMTPLVAMMVSAVGDALTDSSIYVRSIAALAIIKIYRLDNAQHPVLVGYIDRLLEESDPWVLGEAMRAFMEVCPDRLDLLHQRFHKLVKLAQKAHSWGKVAIVEAFISYSRKFFPDPNSPLILQHKSSFSYLLRAHESHEGDIDTGEPHEVDPTDSSLPKTDTAHIDPTDSSLPRTDTAPVDPTDSSLPKLETAQVDPCDPSLPKTETAQMDPKPTDSMFQQTDGLFSEDQADDHVSFKGSDCEPHDEAVFEREEVGEKEDELTQGEIVESLECDRKLLLDCCIDLLHSNNFAVIGSVFKLMFYCGTDDLLSRTIRYLVLVCSFNGFAQKIILKTIVGILAERKSVFEPFIRSFFVFPCDPAEVQSIKLDIVTSLISHNNFPLVVDEFRSYLDYGNVQLGVATVRAIGKIITFNEHVTSAFTVSLLQLFSKKSDVLIGEATIVMKSVLQSEQVDKKPILQLFVIYFDRITTVEARVSMLWVMSEYCLHIKKWVPDVLRKCALTFPDQPESVKLQIINLAIKVVMISPKKCLTLSQYIFNMAKYDDSYFLRDRIRILSYIMSLNATPKEEVTSDVARKMRRGLLSRKKHIPVRESDYKNSKVYQIFTLSSFLGHEVSGYHSTIEDWPQDIPDHTLRSFKFVLPVPEEVEVSEYEETDEEEEETEEEESDDREVARPKVEEEDEEDDEDDDSDSF